MTPQILHSLQQTSFSELQSLLIVTNVVPLSKYAESLGYISVHIMVYQIQAILDEFEGGGQVLHWYP